MASDRDHRRDGTRESVLHPLQSKFLEHAALHMRRLYARLPDRGAGAVGGRTADPSETEVRLLARWQSVPLLPVIRRIVEAVLDAAAEMRQG
jgi:hypothetical protein